MLKPFIRLTGIFLLLLMGAAAALAAPEWTHRARIGTPSDYPELSWQASVDRLVADGMNVILDWHCVSEDWRCQVDPRLADAITEIRQNADYVHTQYPGVRYILYMAPLEMIQPNVDLDRNAQVDPDKQAASIATQHPDWVQVGIDGRSAVFYGDFPGMPFWVRPGAQDTWVTPANPAYRQRALNQAGRLALSGIDGVWFDVPFLAHSFGDNWTDQWPDVSVSARTLFRQQTGLTLPAPPFTVHWDDPVWQAFVNWRYRFIREFVQEYRDAIKASNPAVSLIMESSVGLDPATTQTGASPFDLPLVSDLTAHELGGSKRPYQYYRWLHLLAKLSAWQHIDSAHQQPSWLLSYVEAGHADTLKTAVLHGATVLLSGFNYYTSGGEDMSTLLDAGFRRKLNAWTQAHDSTLFASEPVRPYSNVAVVYSRQTLDFLDRGNLNADDYASAFHGMLMLLLESHIPFTVISENEWARLSDFDAVILPDMAAMSDGQAEAFKDYVQRGGVLIATGRTSRYDERGMPRARYALADVLGVDSTEPDTRVYTHTVGAGKSVFSPLAYEQEYFWAATPYLEQGGDPVIAERERQAFLNKVWSQTQVTPVLSTNAPRSVVLLPMLHGDNKLELRALNYTGVEFGNPVSVPQANITVSLSTPTDRSAARHRRLPYLGNWTGTVVLQPGTQQARFSFPVDRACLTEILLN